MIIVDTNILSTFGKVDKFNLLLNIFEEEFYISPNVLEELKEADKLGHGYVRKILSFISEGRIKVVSLSDEMFDLMKDLPRSFGLGERDSIAAAKINKASFVTNENKLLNFCEREGITAISLNSILRYLWKEGILTKEQVKHLIEEIETKDNIIIMSKEEIIEE